jgi:hypothetical protein
VLLLRRRAVELSELLRFPCKKGNKKPLTTHGFYDARRNVDDSEWPLVGVPTGDVNGFDVLDVDPLGVDWLEQNISRLGITRCHQTRRGGWHYLYRHHPGLGCSADRRISKGIDVRSTGGYSIFWPREGLRVVNAGRLEDWPEWLIPLAMGPVLKRRDLGQSPTYHHHGVIGDGPLSELNVLDYRSYSDWRNLMMSAHQAGIGKEDWVRWSVSDPAYADAADDVGRFWDALKVDRITGWYLRVEIRLAQLNRGGCPKHPSKRKMHVDGVDMHVDGGLSKVPLVGTKSTLSATPTLNLKSRVSSLQREISKGDEDLLFFCACTMREIISEGKINPEIAVQLLEGSWPKSRRDVDVRRTIAAGFLKVEDKLP